ncbi:MAG: hypothetical protein ACI9CF_000610 [Candidatus Omnitrophota bacterium]|jgi:hypothetical protein
MMQTLMEWIETIKKLCKTYPIYAALVVLIVVALTYFLAVTQSMRPAVRGLRTMRQSRQAVPVMNVVPASQRLPNSKALRWLGIDLLPLSRTLRKEFGIPREVQGVFVYGLDKQYGLAALQSVQMFDVIRAVNHMPVSNGKTFEAATSQIPYQDGILLDVYRNGRGIYVSVPFSYDYGALNSGNLAQQKQV